MSVLKYYKENKFNPVPIKFSSINNINNHFKKRINLLDNHLNINLHFLQNKDILEFGCNGGENACLLAKYGANLYLVEPHLRIHQLIKKNFQKVKKLKKLKMLSKKKIEDFRFRKKYDIIITEGFLNTLNNRNYYFRKISKFLNDGGLFILNFDDVFGGFFEYLKSFILINICNKQKIDVNSKKGYALALKLFGKEFNKLNKSRNFQSWWKDQLVNPYASKTWSLKELILLANSQKLKCYSNSPVFNNLNFFKWYKNVENIDLKYSNYNEKVLLEWKKNYLNFFVGHKIINKKTINNQLLLKIEDLTKKMNKCLVNNKHIVKINIPKNFYKFLSINGLSQYSRELKNITSLLNNNENNSEKIINYYIKTKKISKSWGNLLHYVVFKK